MEINFPLKASPGRGKLSPKVTDEGAGQQHLAINTPHPSAHCVRSHLFPFWHFVPPPPERGSLSPRGEGFCLRSGCKN